MQTYNARCEVLFSKDGEKSLGTSVTEHMRMLVEYRKRYNVCPTTETRHIPSMINASVVEYDMS